MRTLTNLRNGRELDKVSVTVAQSIQVIRWTWLMFDATCISARGWTENEALIT
jgi:hypothetical protein